MARGLQKQQSQAKNAGPAEKTPEQRAADRKAALANMTAYSCGVCKQTFANTAKEPMLREHWANKHAKEPPEDVMTKGFPEFKWGAGDSSKKAAKGADATSAAAAAAAAGAGGASKKEKTKDAAAKAAAALAAAAGGGKAPAKKEKKVKSDNPTGAPAEESTPEPAEVEPTAAAECDACEVVPAAEEAPEVMAIPEQVVSEEERTAREAARVEAERIEANYDATNEAVSAGNQVAGVRGMIKGKKGVGVSLEEFDGLLAAADVKYVIKS